MDAKPKRRWYQFSLKTMFILVFVVSIPLAWVGYSLNWIRERRAFGGYPYYSPNNVPGEVSVCQNGISAPWGLWLFGEHGANHVVCPPQDAARARGLFPEAEVTVSDP